MEMYLQKVIIKKNLKVTDENTGIFNILIFCNKIWIWIRYLDSPKSMDQNSINMVLNRNHMVAQVGA